MPSSRLSSKRRRRSKVSRRRVKKSRCHLGGGGSRRHHRKSPSRSRRSSWSTLGKAALGVGAVGLGTVAYRKYLRQKQEEQAQKQAEQAQKQAEQAQKEAELEEIAKRVKQGQQTEALLVQYLTSFPPQKNQTFDDWVRYLVLNPTLIPTDSQVRRDFEEFQKKHSEAQTTPEEVKFDCPAWVVQHAAIGSLLFRGYEAATAAGFI